jgi:DNA primase
MMNNLDELLGKINILDIVSQYVQLRKTGRNFVGLCPFHKEKTPSFTVSIEKQIYYCFGCNEGGNAINFLMKYDNLTFQEAIENLARQYGVKIKRENSKKTSSFDALAKLADYYHKNLKASKFALQYLLNRGIDIKTVDEFKLGYSEKTRQNISVFLKNSGIPSDIFMSTGILRVKEGETYDIFRGRVVIPILDVNKKVIGFGGRTIEKDGFPKYINSPESPVFSKGSSLFGIDKARKSISEKNEVYIVEGYFDLISLYMNGVKNVVSTLGTSVTEGQLTKLRNYTENITLMLDGDEAGIKSALRLIGLFSEMDINGSMVVLPDGHDPDSFIKAKGSGGIDNVMKEKKPILDFYFDYCMNKWGMETIENKQVFIKSVMPHIEAIRNSIKKRLYIKRLSELTNVEEIFFLDNMKENNSTGQSVPRNNSSNHIGRKVVGALMSCPGMFSILKEKEVMHHITDGNIKEILLKMNDFFEEKGSLELNSFINVIDKDELKDLAINGVFDVAECTEDELKIILQDYLKHLEKNFIKEEAKKITEKLSEAEKRGDEKAIIELLEKKRQMLVFLKTNP